MLALSVPDEDYTSIHTELDIFVYVPDHTHIFSKPTQKRRRTETMEISTETYDVTDYRHRQDELMAVDDFMVH